MLLHVAGLEVDAAERSQVGRQNKCFTALVMSALAIEALANAVGSRTVNDWPSFERLSPQGKLEELAKRLAIPQDWSSEPWSSLLYLGRFRNDVAHPKPEVITTYRILPEPGLIKTAFETPESALERESTLGNARRAYNAVHALKRLLADALPEGARYGIYTDMWHGSTEVYQG